MMRWAISATNSLVVGLQKVWPLYGRSDERIDWDRFKAWVKAHQGLVVEGISDVALSRRQHKTRLSDKTTFLVYQGGTTAEYTSY